MELQKYLYANVVISHAISGGGYDALSMTNFTATMIDDDITFKGLSYTLITSPDTGRIWLDRNLGATRVATSATRNSMTNDNSFPNRIIVIHTSNRYHLWTAPVTMIDDDTAGITQSVTSATIAESATATYTVVLDSEPTSDVTIKLTSSDTTAATVTPLLTLSDTSSIIIDHCGSKASHTDSIVTATRNSMTNDNSFPNRIIVIHTSNG
jgi:hypothetical protein